MSANIAELLRASAERHPERTAVIAEGCQLTWAELDQQVDACAATLIARGLVGGDRVALILGNGAPFVIAYFGILRAGLVAVPMNPGYTEHELAPLLAECDASLVVAGTEVPGDRPSIRVSPRDWAALVSERRGRVDTASAADDLALLLFTSGTSGRPKAAMLTHGSLGANLDALLALDSPPVVTEQDVVLVVLPLFHIYGLNTALTLAIAAGAECVIAERFDPVRTLELIGDRRITTVAGAPGMYRSWLAVPGMGEVLRGVRMFSSGGAPLPPEVFAGFAEAVGKAIFEGYGMTETSPVIASTVAGGSARAGSVGPPLAGFEVRIVDDVGAEADDGDPGELMVRGPSVFAGYWPDRGAGIDAEGWFRTGDVAFADEDGYLHLVDRRRELILVNGFNVYPREIELAIEEMPEVAEVAVVGIPSASTGEAVAALVVARPGVELTAAQVIDHCAERLARFKCPATVRVIDELPHSVTGKVAKGRLRELHGMSADDPA